MSEIRTVTLRDIGKLDRGRSRHRPRYAFHLYGGPYPFIQTGDVKAAGKYIRTYEQTYSEAGLAQSRLWPKGTICITIAANIAQIGILSFDACFPDSVIGFIPNEVDCTLDYAYYMLLSYQKELKHLAEGSVQDNINLGTFEDFTFPLPPVSEQRLIAGVLSDFDDKIDLLQRQSQTLEQISETLYRLWVDDDSTQSKLLGSIIDLHDNKRVPLSNLQRSEMKTGKLYPYYGAASKMDEVNAYLFDGDYLLLGEDGTVVDDNGYPILQRVNGRFWVNNHAHVITTRPPFTLDFLELLLRNTSVNHIVTGAVQPKISQGSLKALEVVLPIKEKAETLCKLIAPLFEKRKCNRQQIEILCQTRDTLLPKLMSGEVIISDSEKRLSYV